MIAHGLTRRKGGARVTLDDFARWRDLAAASSPSTLPQVAVDAMTDPDGVTGIVDLTFELESNRNGRPVVSSFVGAPALIDAAMMHTADLHSGRRRPTGGPLCIADTSLADASTAWPSAAEVTANPTDEFPVGVAGIGAVLTANAPRPRPLLVAGDANYFTNTQHVSGSITGATAMVGSSGAGGGRLAQVADGAVFFTNLDGTVVTKYRIEGRGSALNGIGSYHADANGSRTFTFQLKIIAGATVTLTPGIAYRPNQVIGTWTHFDGSGPRTLAPNGAVGAMQLQRLVFSVTVTGLTAGQPLYDVAPYLIVDVPGGSTTRVEVADLFAYVGASERSDVAAAQLGHVITTFGIGVEQQFTGERRFNRLEVTGHDGSVPSAVYVERWTGSAWAALAVGSGTITFDSTITTTGLRVWVEETVGYGGPLLLTEVDAQYVAQLDGDSGVVSCSADWSREADPSQVASPFGNYQTGKLELELDNSANAWSPEANANLDVGHRITAAFGVRYTNLCPNPRADLNLTGWQLEQLVGVANTLTRATEPLDLGPKPPGKVGTALKLYTPNVNEAGVATSEFVACAPGDVFDLAAWGRAILVNPAGTGLLSVAITFYSSTTGRGYATALSRTYALLIGHTGDVWTAGSVQATAPAGAVAVRVEVAFNPQSSPGGYGLATRIRLRRIESGVPVQWESLVPAGVFYSDPFDWGSDDDTVRITASDRLGRNGDVALTEGVRVAQSVGGIVTDLAARGLDLGVDQIAVSPIVANYVIPYAAPAANVGTYLADLAKSVAGCLYLDALERLVVERRDAVTTSPIVAELRGDNALIRYQRPAGYDLTTSAVKVTASPLLPAAAPAEVWAMPSGGFQVPALSSKTIVAPYSTTPVIALFLSGAIADQVSYTLTPTFYADRAEILVTNPNGVTLTLADLRVQGTALAEQSLSTVASDAASVKRYGNRSLDVDVRLVQTQSQLETVATVLLDGFKALDANGVRRLPDLVLDAMGLLHLEGGDRVIVKNPRTGLGEPFAVLGRTLAYDVGGQILSTGVRVRQSPDVTFMVADLHLADDVAVAGA